MAKTVEAAEVIYNDPGGAAMVVQPHERLFSVEEYYRMAEVGIIGRDERVELIDGRIVAMNPIGSPHAWCANRTTRVFARRDDCMVSIQNPIRLGDNGEPEPDLVVMRPETPMDRHPRSEDILLVVEVADSSLAYDRRTKAPLYARHGIPELWIADLGGERVEVHREPSASGYRVVEAVGRGRQIAPAFAPDFAVDVDAIFGLPTG